MLSAELHLVNQKLHHAAKTKLWADKTRHHLTLLLDYLNQQFAVHPELTSDRYFFFNLAFAHFGTFTSY
jgi:glutathione S-transferase